MDSQEGTFPTRCHEHFPFYSRNQEKVVLHLFAIALQNIGPIGTMQWVFTQVATGNSSEIVGLKAY